MSKFACPIISVGEVLPHPNADNLSVVTVYGENVVIRTGDFRSGDLAIYVPVESVVPASVPGTEFLGDHRRIKARRLRGVYSEGLLLPISILPLHQTYPQKDVSKILGIVKYEDEVPEGWGGTKTKNRSLKGTSQQEKTPTCIPRYDIEPYNTHPELMIPLERVIVTEKLHGTQARFAYVDKKFYVGSHNCFWRDPLAPPSWRWRLFSMWRTLTRRPVATPVRKENLYWLIARQYALQDRLRAAIAKGLAIYGEIFGNVQDLTYQASPGQVWFRVFDIYDMDTGTWLGWDNVVQICQQLGLDTVPVLNDGPFDADMLRSLVEGQSQLASQQIREGVVVKPATTRYSTGFGRVVLKYVSQAYKLRKGATKELH